MKLVKIVCKADDLSVSRSQLKTGDYYDMFDVLDDAWKLFEKAGAPKEVLKYLDTIAKACVAADKWGDKYDWDKDNRQVFDKASAQIKKVRDGFKRFKDSKKAADPELYDDAYGRIEYGLEEAAGIAGGEFI